MGQSVEIPDKLFFRIGEVSSLLGLEPHVLRYWETEFPSLRPQKSRANQRLYRRKDVEVLQSIQRLLHEEGFTIAGARKALARTRGGAAGPEEPGAAQLDLGLQSGGAESIREPALAEASDEPSELPAEVARLRAELEAEREANAALRHKLREGLTALREAASAWQSKDPDGA